MLWLALHFPWLPIESLPLRQPPSAVVAQGRVWLGDAAAGEAGVCPGQKLATALGLVPGLAVSVRRLHDIGKSGWWLLLNIVPLVGPLVLLYFAVKDSQPGSNQYGPNPKAVPVV